MYFKRWTRSFDRRMIRLASGPANLFPWPAAPAHCSAASAPLWRRRRFRSFVLRRAPIAVPCAGSPPPVHPSASCHSPRRGSGHSGQAIISRIILAAWPHRPPAAILRGGFAGSCKDAPHCKPTHDYTHGIKFVFRLSNHAGKWNLLLELMPTLFNCHFGLTACR